MRICMFTNTYLPHVGGVALSVKTFVEDLRGMGHDVLVVAPTFEGHEDLGEEPEDVVRVPAIQNFNGSDFSVRIPLPFVISDRIDRFDPQVVHSHHPFLMGDAALRTAKRRNLPLIFTHHTMYEKYTHYAPLDSKTMKRFAIHLSVAYANMCSAVIAPSLSVARLLKRRGVDSPITEIPTGVDIGFFRSGDGPRFRDRHAIPEQALVVGHLGRLAPEKNLSFLAKAAAGFCREKKDAWFLVVGQGPGEQNIRRVFERDRMQNRLVMAGVLQGQDLADAYRAMDVFVFASKSETQGMVLSEAMAAGVPVIALNAPGVREVVRDGINGRLLPGKAAIEAFTRALLEFAADPESRKKWTANTGRTAEKFSRRTCARRLARLYNIVLDTREHFYDEQKIKPWESVVRALKVEWDLFSEKASAAVKAVRADEQTESRLE